MPNNGILIVAVGTHGSLSPTTFELITAGQKLSAKNNIPLSALVLSEKANSLAALIAERGVQKVFALEHANFSGFTEDLFAKVVADFVQKEGFSQLILSSTIVGRALAARLSVLLKAALIVDISEISDDGKIRRPFYSGNLIADVEIKTPISVLTIAPLSFARAENTGAKGQVQNYPVSAEISKTKYQSFQPETSNEIDMGTADRIVSGGRGLGSAEGFKPVYELAHAINAAVGASRAAVDSGWIPYKHQVGLTGRSVRPKLYVAVGISGQIQHLAGMSSSGTIVAINTKTDCPMMTMANIAVQGDYSELLPLITQEIHRRKGSAAVTAA